MIKLNLDLPYNIHVKGDAKPLKNIEYSVDYIEFAVNKKYQNGLQNQFRRLWARLQRKFDDVLDEKSGPIVELENGEFDFLKGSVHDCEYPANLAKYIVVLEDEFERASKQPSKGE